MKILHIISKGYAHGGAEQLLLETISSLAAQGHTVRTLASDLSPEKEHFNDYSFKGLHSFSFIAGTPISTAPLAWQYLTYPLKLPFFLFNFSSFFALRKILREYQPDVIHLHTMIQVSPSVLFLLRRHPTVMTLCGPETFLRKLLLWCLTPADFKHDFYGDMQDLNGVGKLTYAFFAFLQKTCYRVGLQNVDVFIAPSRYIQHCAIDVSPIVHVPNFVDLPTVHELSLNYQILYVGRLVNVKGVDVLLTAFPTILNAFPQARLTIVGDGFGRIALSALVAHLGLEHAVSMVGHVPHEKVQAYYEKACLVVIPSRWPENFPTVCLEAMSAGLPVIGTNVGGIPELIDEENGCLVEPEAAEQIAEKVITLFQDEQRLRWLGYNGRKKAENFSVQKYIGVLERIYEDVRQKYEPQRP